MDHSGQGLGPLASEVALRNFDSGKMFGDIEIEEYNIHRKEKDTKKGLKVFTSPQNKALVRVDSCHLVPECVRVDMGHVLPISFMRVAANLALKN